MSNKRKIYLFTLLCLCLSITNFSYSFKLKQLLPHSRNPSSKRLFCNLQDNFYEVEKNTFYRSKQLSDKKLKFYIKKFNIKTIINLRGNNKNAKWWQREKKVTIQKRIHFYNIPMSAKYLPCRPNLLYLLHIYQNAPRPILIHCLGGADRTGEASAIWLMDQQKKTKRKSTFGATLGTAGFDHFVKNLVPSRNFF